MPYKSLEGPPNLICSETKSLRPPQPHSAPPRTLSATLSPFQLVWFPNPLAAGSGVPVYFQPTPLSPTQKSTPPPVVAVVTNISYDFKAALEVIIIATLIIVIIIIIAIIIIFHLFAGSARGGDADVALKVNTDNFENLNTDNFKIHAACGQPMTCKCKTVKGKNYFQLRRRFINFAFRALF